MDDKEVAAMLTANIVEALEELNLCELGAGEITPEHADALCVHIVTLKERAVAAEARVRELEANDRRYRWLRDDAREALCAREQGDNPIHPHLWAHWPVRGERLDAAIDSAMQGEEVRGA